MKSKQGGIEGERERATIPESRPPHVNLPLLEINKNCQLFRLLYVIPHRVSEVLLQRDG